MGYINLFLSTPCKLSVKNKQLVVQGEEEQKFPIEDLNCLMIETHQCNLSSYLLQILSLSSVAVFCCDATHIPNGIMLPLCSHYSHFKILKAQLEISKPLEKQLWQDIVKQKIKNQAECCNLLLDINTSDLIAIAESVSSGDSLNKEATAANIYFKKLFGKGFSRQKESVVNDCLNYGYAIIRGIIARTLIVHGFEPSLGLHHKNQLNNFNLADDMIEPFRAVVDYNVFRIIDSLEGELTPQVKKVLFNLINQDVLINENIQSLNYAVEIMVESLSKSLQNGKRELALPELLKINTHKYE